MPDINQPPVANGLPAMKESADIEPTILPLPADGVSAWLDLETQSIYQRLADQFDMELMEVSVRFGEVRLTDKRWKYHPLLGVYAELE